MLNSISKINTNNISNNSNFIPNGTKEACLKVWSIVINDSKLEPDTIQALRRIIAFTFSKSDETPTMYYCDKECRFLSRNIFCDGEMLINKDSENRCPYFEFDPDQLPFD